MKRRSRIIAATLLGAVVLVGFASLVVLRARHWVNERDQLELAVFGVLSEHPSADVPPAIELTSAGDDGPPKPMPLLWRWLGASPHSEITLDPSTSDALYQRYVAAFPEANVQRAEVDLGLTHIGGQEKHD